LMNRYPVRQDHFLKAASLIQYCLLKTYGLFFSVE